VNYPKKLTTLIATIIAIHRTKQQTDEYKGKSHKSPDTVRTKTPNFAISMRETISSTKKKERQESKKGVPTNLHTTNFFFRTICQIQQSSAISLTSAETGLGGLATTSTSLEHLTFGSSIRASVFDRSGISIVGINSNQQISIFSSDTLDVDIALALRLAIATAAVEFAKVLDVVVDDVYGAAAVVLDHFVGSVVGASADDPGLAAGLVVFDADGVFADVFEPDVFEGAVAVAVDAFGLVLADDDVLQCGSGFEEEDGVGFAWWWRRDVRIR